MYYGSIRYTIHKSKEKTGEYGRRKLMIKVHNCLLNIVCSYYTQIFKIHHDFMVFKLFVNSFTHVALYCQFKTVNTVDSA